VPRLETILKLAGAIEVDPCELRREMRWQLATDSRPGRFRYRLVRPLENERFATGEDSRTSLSGERGGNEAGQKQPFPDFR
jgi:hypothetical protein